MTNDDKKRFEYLMDKLQFNSEIVGFWRVQLNICENSSKEFFQKVMTETTIRQSLIRKEIDEFLNPEK